MKLYTIIFTNESGSKTSISVRQKNKVLAVNEAFTGIRSWREKDKVVQIDIVEDAGNEEATAEDYL